MPEHSSPDNPTWYVPPLPRPPRRRPRISGSALVGGLHLATGNYGTAPWWQLTLSGLAIVAALGLAMVLTFIEGWLLDRWLGLGLTAHLLGLPAPAAPGQSSVLPQVVLTVLPMLNFLVVLRLSPLSGYHAAEHKVVAAIETYGDLQWDQVVEMPRAHPRCGTVLLFGLLPGLLIAWPLLWTQPVTALMVALVGWYLRYPVGFFIQQNFTTKPPTIHQLETGIAAGRKLLALWQSDPDRRVSLARNLWTRGLPQMLAGVFFGQYLLSLLSNHLHVLLDW
jgi:hypothetical protein